MKNLFRNIPLHIKLLLTGIIPLAFAFILALQNNQQKQERLHLLENFRDNVVLNSYIGELSQTLLTERRVSFAHRMNQRYSEAELLNQQAKTDAVISKIDEFDKGKLGDYKRYTLLNRLPSFRRSILKDSITVVEILDFYSPIMQRLITLMNGTSEKPSFIPMLNEKISADNLLLQMSNSIAVLRSDIYYVLVNKTVTESFFEKIKTGWMGFRAMELEFFEKADSASISAYREILKLESTVAVVTVLEEINNTSNIMLAADSEEWWRNSIKMVEDLKELKESVVADILESVRQKYMAEKNEKNISLALLLTVIVLVMAIIYFSIRSIAATLGELSDAARKLSLGELGLTISKPTRDVVGKLAQAVMTIDTNKQKMAAAAADIGKGKFDTPLNIRSEKDVIGKAMLEMRTNLINLSAEQEEKIWMQGSVRAVADAMLGNQSVESISQRVLEMLAKIIGFEVGAFYVAKLPDQLHYVSGYALERESDVQKVLNRGQSLAGQAFEEKRMISVEAPENFYRISTAAGKSKPHHVIIFPLIANHQVEGVIEIGKLTKFGERSIRLLEEVSEKIAVALNAAKSRTRLQELLEETQAQSEELQVQHSEMENLNTELEAHTQKLQASEEELRVQQEELQQANAELEERTRLLEEKNQEIAERTLEIQAKAEQLEASTKYKSEFLANMSHELRTPLNSILLLSRLMADNTEKNLTEEQVEYSRVIQSSGQGLLLLINEILDLSKIEAGKMTLEFESVLLQTLLSEMKAMFEPMANEKNLAFDLKVADGVPEIIHTDKLRLEQVIRNLISNSLKFTQQGSIQIEVKPVAGGNLSFTVADTGIGIAPEKQELIFDAFQQADGSTRRKFGGTGLGLSISRELVKLLGGRISVSSEPGKGSRFTITVPVNRRNKTEEVDLRPESPAEHQKETEKSEYISTTIPESIPDDRKELSPGDKSILIIEDDVNFARSLIEYTRQRGYKALCAVRGDEGIELARTFKPSGILLDIQLPVKSGWQVMEELKNDPLTRHIPVHIMSSHQVRNESLLKGAINFIHKPVAYDQMNDIFKRIEHIVSKESQKVLILEENPQHAKALAYFLESSQINTDIKHSINEGVEALKSDVDCVVLDMGIPNQQAYDMLENIKSHEGMENIPVIVFTGKSLSAREQERISKYADSIVVKTAQSYQRILSEISLFLHIVESDSKRTGKNKMKKGGLMDEVLKNKTVLVVDDDVRNIFSLSKSLEKYQMNVVTATDGREALEKLSENKDVDVVLLDMMMPRMDGYETAKKIRENKQYKDLPVIAVTAKAMTGDREKCISAGASDYITKPVDTDQLLSLLRVWLYEKR